MKSLKLGGLQLPAEAATESSGILAKKGAGKSNAAVVMAEEMHRAGIPWVAIDPKGDWWGVRAAGDGPGLPVAVFGGRHGDIPLEATGGTVLADTVLGEAGRGYLTCVLDVSQFTISDQRRFLLDFGQRLFQRKDESGVLHLFLEEAHEYLPQRVDREQTRLVSTWQRIVKQGRFKGLGVTVISQRSAALNKDVLTQVDSLYVLRTLSPQDRAAVKAWLDVHVGASEVIGTLHELKNGEAWLWSPDRFKDPMRFQFRRRATFDSGATPTFGAKAHAATLADVDLGAIKKQMAATIEKAKAEDPAELRRLVADLRKQLASKPVAKQEVKPVEVPALKPQEVKLLRSLVINADLLASKLTEKADEIREGVRALSMALHRSYGDRAIPALDGKSQAVRKAVDAMPVMPRIHPVTHQTQSHKIMRPPNSAYGDLTGPEQRILDALAWMESIGVTEPEQPAVAFLAGYTIGGGAWNNPRGALRTKGMIEYRGDRISMTAEGRALARQPGAALTTEELHRKVLDRLPGPERKLLSVLLEKYPAPIGNEDLARAAGYEPGGGAYNNPRGRLRSLGLIEKHGDQFKARDILFLP